VSEDTNSSRTEIEGRGTVGRARHYISREEKNILL
jgi:hypothetical protein